MDIGITDRIVSTASGEALSGLISQLNSFRKVGLILMITSLF